MNFSALVSITGGEVLCQAFDGPLSFLITDSRKPLVHEGALFIAMVGERHDGHDYIRSLYERGVRHVEKISQLILSTGKHPEFFLCKRCNSLQPIIAVSFPYRLLALQEVTEKQL